MTYISHSTNIQGTLFTYIQDKNGKNMKNLREEERTIRDKEDDQQQES